MRKYTILLVTAFLTLNLAVAQTVQGTIKKLTDFSIGVYVKPSGGNISGSNINWNLTVSLDAFGQTNTDLAPIPTSVTTLSGASLNTTTPVELLTGRFVYAYIITGAPTGGINWISGTEYLILTVVFPNNAQTQVNTPQLNDYLPGGGASGQALFDIGVGGPFYTNVENMFYGTNVSNNGPEDPSSVETNQPLPITLISFEANKLNDRSAHLSWTTTSEINSSHFNIQRSTDRVSWAHVGKISAQGNSQVIKNYEFVDQNVYNGTDAKATVFYRLQMVDIDEQSKISPIESVVFGTGANTGHAITAYPNPASDGIQVEWEIDQANQPTAIELYNIDGKLVYTAKVAPNSNQEYIDFGFTNIQSGLYLLRLVSGDVPIENKQIVVQR